MLKQRILTALVLVPLILWALFGLADDYLLLLFAIILMLGAFEWLKLAEIENLPGKLLFLSGQLVLIGIVWWLSTRQHDVALVVLLSVSFAWLMIMFWLAMHERGIVKIRLTKASRILLGIALLPACLLGIGLILDTFANDRFTILLMFVLIWGADIGAYFSGKAFGKHKLAPSISPGKSWEGVYGALAGTVLIALVASQLLDYPISSPGLFVLFCLVVVILSIVGDLFESLLKRQVGVKDSSHILPGHGGVLDRIDSLIAASPVFTTGMYLLGAA